MPYRLARQFVVRLTGAPLEALDRFATPRSSAAARDVARLQALLDDDAVAALAVLRALPAGAASTRLARSVGMRRQLPADALSRSPTLMSELALVAYQARHDEMTAALAALDGVLAEELAAACVSPDIVDALERFLVFSPEKARDVVDVLARPQPDRDRGVRKKQHTALLYLQRICAKNDTISEFGPTVWGKVDEAAVGWHVDVAPGIAAREAFFEKWVAVAIAAKINGDDEARAEVAPRLHPLARLERGAGGATSAGGAVVRVDSPAAPRALTAHDRAVVDAADGVTAARAVGALADVRRLADDGVLLWELQAPAFDPHRLRALQRDVEGWRDGAAKARWLPLLRSLHDACEGFANAATTAERTATLNRARELLAGAGIEPPAASRGLYSGTNILGEECARSGRVVLGGDLAARITGDAAGWLDAFRDTYSYASAHVGARLAALFRELSPSTAPVPLPVYLAHCEAAGVSLTGPSITQLAARAFADVKRAFADQTAQRADAREWQLTAEDCAFVRRRLDVTPLDGFTFPAPDVQLVASSAAAAARGECEVLLAELHTAFAPLGHGAFWACPDPADFGRDFASVTRGAPTCNWGMSQGQDRTSHNSVHWLEGLGDLWTHVAGERVRAGSRASPPSEVEVFLDGSGDVQMRTRAGGNDGKVLGSFARSFSLAFGVHPFLFTRDPHTPRLRLGSVILQRETWLVRADELTGGPFHGKPALLQTAVERLRAEKGWPRRIYTRPTHSALGQARIAGRDKDLKPIFIDLESHPFVEIFHKHLIGHGELEVTEMLPTLEQTPWREDDGTRMFELRMLAVPDEP